MNTQFRPLILWRRWGTQRERDWKAKNKVDLSPSSTMVTQADGAWVFPRGRWGYKTHSLGNRGTHVGLPMAAILWKIGGSQQVSYRTGAARTFGTFHVPVEYSNFCHKKKKSGKWRLLHDLRAINAQMNLFGSIQRGLPLLSALPKQWKIVIVRH